MYVSPQSTMKLLIIGLICANTYVGASSLKILSAKFIDSYKWIEVVFENPLTFDSMELECGFFFDFETLKKLGENVKCLIKDSKTLMVTPSFTTDQNELSLTTLSAPDEAFPVASPDIMELILRASAAKGSCLCTNDVLYFNIDQSSNLGYGRLVNISWSLSGEKLPEIVVIQPSSSLLSSYEGMTILASDSVNTTLMMSGTTTTNDEVTLITSSTATTTSSLSSLSTASASSSSLSTSTTPTTPPTTTTTTPTTPPTTTTTTPPPYVASLLEQHGKTEVKIKLSQLQTHHTYTLSVQATNVLGEVKSTETKFDIKIACIPVVDIFQISSLLLRQPISFEAAVHYPACWNQSSIPTFKWDITTNNSSISLGNTVRNKNVISAESVYFSSATLYSVSVNVAVKDIRGEDQVITKTRTFNVYETSFAVGILGGDREVGNDTLTLKSYAFSEKDGNLIGGTYKWSCQTENTTDCLKNNVKLVLPSTKNLDVDIRSGDFVIGKRYTFSLEYANNGKVFTDSVSVKFVDAELPYFYVYTKQRHDFVSHGYPVMFTAVLGGKLNGVYRLQWSCFDDFLKIYSLPSEVQIDDTIVVTNLEERYLIRHSHLTIPSGYRYQGRRLICSCSLTHRTKASVASDRVIYKYSISNAELSVEDVSGSSKMYGSSTPFRIRVHGFLSHEELHPLMFRYGYYVDKKTNAPKYLTTWSTNHILENVRLPLIESALYVTVFVIIRDLYGIKTYLTGSDLLLSKPAATPTKESLIQLYDSTLKYDPMQASQYLYNNFALDTKVEKMEIIFYEYIQLVVANPVIQESLSNAIDLTRLYFEMFGKDFTMKVYQQMEMFISFVTNHLSYTTESDINNLLIVVDGILKNSTLRWYIEPKVDSIITKIYQHYLERMNTEHVTKTILNFGEDSHYLDITLKKEYFSHSVADTIIAFTGNITNYDTWKCDSVDGALCNGLYITQVTFDNALYEVFNNFSEPWRMVTKVYDVKLWSPKLSNLLPEQINTTGSYEYFDLNIPVEDEELTPNDNIYCQVLDDYKARTLNASDVLYFDMDNTTICKDTKFVNNGGGKPNIRCRCQKLGKIAVFKEFIPTTEEPDTVGDNITVSLYFYAPKSMCIFEFTRFKYFSAKLIPALAKELRIPANRITILGCDIGSIIVHIHIIDVIGQRRNVNLEGDIQRLIRRQLNLPEEERFAVKMNSGSYWLFDVDMTTPKPPPPTIPPIGDVNTDWLPIGIAIALTFFVFLLCGVAACMIHTRYLKNQVFTEVNSDKKIELTEEEEIELKDRKARILKLNTITEEAIDGVDSDLSESTTSLNKRRNKKSIHPVTDSNSINVGNNQYSRRQPANLDEPRLALDDSSDEDTPPSLANSSAELFRVTASRTQLKQTNTDEHQPQEHESIF